MPWIITTGRPSGRFEPIDDDDDEYPLNGFACIGEIRAFTICCPACGALHEITARRRAAACLRPTAAGLPLHPMSVQGGAAADGGPRLC